MSSSYDPKPWYIQKKKKSLNLLNVNINKNSALKNLFIFIDNLKIVLILFLRTIFGIFFGFAAGFCFSKLFLTNIPGKEFLIYLGFSFIFLMICVYFLIAQIGSICVFFMEKKYNLSHFIIGLFYLQSKIEKSNAQKGLLAPEMILRQFFQQVRIYSAEKSYYSQKRFENQDIAIKSREDTLKPRDEIQLYDIVLKRRWNDVQDTLDEFDVYLANNQKDVLTKLATNLLQQNRDVSHVFRDAAETAESTWRAKGVHIEHAIVVPLKSDINDKLLRRLLSGPWRACAYLCARGSGVVFSAKTEKNKIVARWECEGVAFPNAFYELIKNQALSVNERIENGMELITNDPKNSNVLFGLISLIIWHDLAAAAMVNFDIIQGNDGMIVKLKI